jgi:hypothetical protein
MLSHGVIFDMPGKLWILCMDQTILNRHRLFRSFPYQRIYLTIEILKRKKSNQRFSDFALCFIAYFKIDSRYAQLCGMLRIFGHCWAICRRIFEVGVLDSIYCKIEPGSKITSKKAVQKAEYEDKEFQWLSKGQ